MKTTQTKHCHQCDTTKTVDQFYKHRSKEDGRQTQCKDCQKARQKARYSEHGEEIRSKVKAYYAANREEVIARVIYYNRNRLAHDPVFRWVHKTRVNLRDILRGKGSHQPTLDLLGCTRQEYRDHLESKFTDDMSWDNYGEWHVDHIIPVSAFDQSDLEQRKECWHYSNTQPLWAEDNMAKGTSIPTESTNEQ